MDHLKSLALLISALVIGYLLIVLLITLFQKHLIYYPVSRIVTSPADIGLSYQDVRFKTSDDVQLHGWYISHPDARAVVIFCHGNAGNISGRLETIRLLHHLELDVLIFDYRGYGKSEGDPSETGTYRDLEGAWHYLTEAREVTPDNIVLMGRSLGGAIAAELASRVQPAAVILESSFTSAVDIGRDVYGWLPVRLLITFKYETIKYVESITAPILIIHSREDELIPFQHGVRLFEAANDPKYFFAIEGPHGGGFLETGELYITRLDQFISQSLLTQNREE